MLISKKQMAHHLGVSISTLERMCKRGELTPLYGDETNFGKRRVFFELPDPEPSVTVTVRPEPSATPSVAHPEPTPPSGVRSPSNVDAKLESDFHFAHRYLSGHATDSFGNKIDGTNSKYSEPYTILGPHPQVERRPVPTTTSHMNPALVGGRPLPGVAHAGDMSHPLLKGFNGIEKPQRPQHPNLSRNQLLNLIIDDIKRGYSR